MGNFSSLNTALSAMRYQQVALDIASTNVANGGTDGYVRRRVVGETVGSGAVPAVWSRTSEVAAGVRASAERAPWAAAVKTSLERAVGASAASAPASAAPRMTLSMVPSTGSPTAA